MAAIGAGVLGLLCLSSSAYAAMNMGGDEETPAPAPTPTPTPVVPDTQDDEADSASVDTPKVITGPTKGQYIRLWQGKPYQNQDAYALNILELEVYDSSGTNIAQGKSATARTQYPGNNQPVLAFDGSLDTKYKSNHDNEEDWLEVDLGSEIDIHKIVIRHSGDENVHKEVAVKDRLRGYIEIFDGNTASKTGAKTAQIEETSTDNVYTYNFKERGGGKWRGGQGILKTRADIIAKKQAADAAAADAEQKRLASVADKAAADKAAADKAAADKAAADKAAADAATAAESQRITSLKASMVDYETVACQSGTDPKNDTNNKWEWGNDDRLRLYPNPQIAASWKSDWSTNYKTINCTGIAVGPDNVMNPNPTGGAVQTEAERIGSLKASMVDFATVACEAGTDPRNDTGNKWEWGADDKLRLYPNPQIADSWVSDWRTNYKTINCTGITVGPDNGMNMNNYIYKESCDDLGGGVLVRHESGKDLGDCRNECAPNASCKGFIHKADVGFCQLHDNNDPYGVNICGQGYTVHRK